MEFYYIIYRFGGKLRLIWNKLFKKIAVFFVFLLFFVTSVTLSMGDQGAEEPTESSEVIMVNETSIKLTISFPTFEFGSVSMDEEDYATVKVPGEGFTTAVGEAKLPQIKYILEIPQGAEPKTLITSNSWKSTSLKDLSLPEKIVPVQPSVLKIPETKEKFVIDNKYYSTNEFSPDSIVNITDIGEIRERRFALVEFSPIQYNPKSGEIKTITNCEIVINLPGSNMEKTYEKIKRYSTPSFENLYGVLFENYGYYEKEINLREDQGYLIIVYDGFVDEIQTLADLKESKGFETTITKTSDIPGGETKENIKDYIEEAYNEWTTPPSYVLLVGDTPQIPTYYGTTSGPTAVDLYYVTINSEDYFPDIFIGRFPASTKSHVTAMVNKTVYYEQGKFNSTEWIKKAAFMAGNDNYHITEATHNFVIETFLESDNYTYDKLYEVTYGAQTQDVTDALNDGRSLAIYSGHGSPSGWADGPPFYQSDVRALTNKDMYPFVCSHACSTNTFNDAECFGETWLREEGKAGLAFWGASASTYWNEDDILEKGMFKAWRNDDLNWIGGMTDMGLYYLYENYSGEGFTKYYFEAYNVMGDPSVNIWKKNPNPPPETPDTPQGPTNGVIDKELTYSGVTTDPDGEQIYYKFSWGDETTSEWVGPYDSGDQGNMSHIWTEPGVYEIKVKAKDENESESDWSNPLRITIIQGPLVLIDLISGGLFRINVEIQNIGSTNATNVTWNISAGGGTIFLGKESGGVIPSILPEKKIQVQSNIILGFGEIEVTVTAEIPENTDTRTQRGKVMLFLIYINPGG